MTDNNGVWLLWCNFSVIVENYSMLDLLGLNLQTKMLVRLYALPTLLLLGSALLSLLLLISVEGYQEHADKVSLLITVKEVIYSSAGWLNLLLLVLSCLFFAYSSFRFWKWHKGESKQVCHMCGGMVVDKDGRFGPSYKCLACGTNRSIYR